MAKKKKPHRKTFSIIDIDGFAKMVRDNAIEAISGTPADLSVGDGKSPEDYLRIEQVKGLVEQKKVGDDIDGKPLITEKILDEICDISTVIVFGVGLAKLASEGFLEVSFNSDTNDFEFQSSGVDRSHG